MTEDFGPDIITLLDDDNNEHEFEVIDELEYEDELYYALYPTENNQFILDDAGYYIFKIVEVDGEEQLEEVDDNDLLNTLADIFEERFNDSLFEEEGEEE